MSDIEKNIVLPRASVIVPVFNDEKGVLACLEALRQQTCPADRFEVVVVDNGSSPPLDIREEFPFRVRIEACKTLGSYAARNKGVALSKGEILAFTDADCKPDSEWLERGVAALAEGEGRYIVGGEVMVAEPERRTGAALYQHLTGFHQQANIERKGFSVTANVFCTAEQFQVVGPFEERLLSGGDREWFWRAAKKGLSVVFEPQAMVNTAPRSTLRSAIGQARRTAAGRYYLRKHELDHLGPEAVARHRSSWESITWILTRHQLSWKERVKVLYAAIVIKIAAAVETLRLRLGGTPERR